MTDQWIEAVRDCIIGLSDHLSRNPYSQRAREAEKALSMLVEALIAAGQEAPDA